jgi:hypothetical protein
MDSVWVTAFEWVMEEAFSEEVVFKLKSGSHDELFIHAYNVLQLYFLPSPSLPIPHWFPSTKQSPTYVRVHCFL